MQYLMLIILLVPLQAYAQTPTGHIKFEFTNTDSAYVVHNAHYSNPYRLASGDSLQFEEGRQWLKLYTPIDKSGNIFVQVFKDSTITLSHIFNTGKITTESLDMNVAARYYFNANVMVLSDEDSEIYFKGEYKGTGFAKFDTFGDIGELEIKNPDFGQTKRRLNVPEHRVSIIASDLRPVESFSRVFSILPGASQLYKRQYLKAFIFGASAVTLFTSAGIKSSQYHNELDVFYEYQEDYDNARNEQEALRLGDLAENQHNKVQRIDNQRRGLFLAGILICGYNIYDAFTSKPNGGYAKNEKDLEIYLSQEEISGFTNTSGTIRYNF